MSKSYTLIAFM